MGLVPVDVLTAVAGGWCGVTLVEGSEPGELPLVVCVAPEGRLRGLRGGALSIGAPDGVVEHRLVLGLEPPVGAEDGCDPLELSLDLSQRSARELVERLAGYGALRIAWIPCDGVSWALEDVELGAYGSGHLRAAAARAAEWHAEEPAIRMCRDCWVVALQRAPCLVTTAGPHGEVLVVVPAETLAGVDGRPARMALGSALVTPGGASADLEIGLNWGGDEGPEVARLVGLSLSDPGQRALAARLARQRQVTIVAADDSDAPSAALRASLGPCARHLLAEALRCAGGETPI